MEVFAVDDASGEASRNTGYRYSADARIRILRHGSAAGAAVARNHAAAEAKGDFLAFLDDDDEWLPGKLFQQVIAVRETGAGVGTCAFAEVAADGTAYVAGTVDLGQELPTRTLLRGNVLGLSATVVRRTIFQAVGGFDEWLPRLQDWDLWIRLSKRTSFVHLPHVLARVHLSPNSISRDAAALRRAALTLSEKYAPPLRGVRGASPGDQLTSAEFGDMLLSLARLLLRAGETANGRQLATRALRAPTRRPRHLLAASAMAAFPSNYTLLSQHLTRRAQRAARIDTEAGQCDWRDLASSTLIDHLVSVVIPTYQDREWIVEAVSSALSQTYPHIEVIVVDDGSTDGTAGLLQERFGGDIRLIRQNNGGLAAARNAGLRAARGEWIQFLDADDRLDPNKVAAQMAALAEHPQFDIAYCEYSFTPAPPARARWGVPTGPAKRSGDLLDALCRGNFIAVHAALMSKRAALEAGGFARELGGAEDYDLWLRMAARGHRFLHTPGSHVLYGARPGSLASDEVRQIRWTIRVLDRAYAIIPAHRRAALQALRTHRRRLTDYLVFCLIRRAVRKAARFRVSAALVDLVRALGTDPAGIPRRGLRAVLLPFWWRSR